MEDSAPMVGVVLAGGRGKRIGGDKANVAVEGRPLLRWVLAALEAVCPEVVVVAKRDTVLPGLRASTRVWVEPDQPVHPLTGIIHALRQAEGRPVLVCATDLVLLDPGTLRAIVAAADPERLAVVPFADGRLQPLCALYQPGALRILQRFQPETRTADAAAELDPVVVGFDDPRPFFNVNGPEDVLHASSALRPPPRAR
jgi:molybdopterin-guanine dinucleotide biosynthesis protein A